ncbi:response regulator [Laspinema olomoucense]|uniref:response regulator n=1 Tax=Laspinema olomoucense TaxID=3231600 RepID=UPI0021BB12C6|nr:response regulator [Laspinema sp. D3c]MCT7997258.1 response regulator [Laspinema sp. D3c]
MILESLGCAKIAGELAALMQQKVTGIWLVVAQEYTRSSQPPEPGPNPLRDRLPVRPNQSLGKKRSTPKGDSASPTVRQGKAPPSNPCPGERQWRFYLVMGRLLYITESVHRVRRWSRALRQHCPKFVVDPQDVAEGEPWEFQLLQPGMEQHLLSPTHAKALIRTSSLEALFNLASYPKISTHWHPLSLESLQIPSNIALSSLDVAQVFQKAEQLWEQWEQLGLHYISPDLSPVLSHPTQLKQQVSSESFLTLNTLFNGENTIWDLAIERKQSIVGVTRTLHHFVEQGKISLQTVSDWPSPLEQWRIVRAAVAPKKPLIACIDDSPLVSEILAGILQPAGYDTIAIQDPMQGVAILSEKKPDFIFLDLVMPQTNGYNLCNFLRQSNLFRETPIVILTSQDGIIDRTRAKLNGASDFLSKPPQAEKVLQMVEKYLKGSDRPNPLSDMGFPALA